MMITATKVKAIHIPYPTPAPPHTHRLYRRGIQVIQKVGVPVMETVRNRAV